jgi:hypothetical protein
VPLSQADRELPHSSLRDEPGDAGTSVIMVPGGYDPPPGRAGDLLGTLDQPYRMPDGETVPAGAKVYRDLAPQEGGLPPEVPDSLISGLDEARGVPWARGAEMGSVPFRVMNPEPGEDALTVRLQPSDIQRRGLRMEIASTGGDLPDWAEVHDPAPPVTHHLRAGDVLDIHARLAETMARPPARLLEFFDAFVSSTLDRAGKDGGDWAKVNRWAGMFWPAQTAAEWCGILARQLRTARTYEVTAPMTEAVHELYTAVRDHRVTTITRDDLPWPSGFAYLDKPVTLTDPHGNSIYNRAYSWDVVYLPYPGRKVPGVRIITWSHPDDRDSYWSESTAAALEFAGGLGMGNTILVPFGQRLDPLPGEDGRPRDSVALWLRCLWFTLESVIGTTRTAPRAGIGRQAYRRARRSLDHAEVNVVLLRRAMTLPPEPSGEGHHSTRWTCRWFVDEFWRHSRRDLSWEQDNEERDDRGRVVRHHAIPDHTRERCIRCGAKVVKVATFDKGPPGLPYKQARQLHKLAR